MEIEDFNIIQEQYDSIYSKNAKKINTTFDVGEFLLTIEKAGSFKIIKEGVETDFFRLDLELLNVQDFRSNFYTYSFKIFDPTTERYYKYIGGQFKTMDIRPNETRKGYVLFEPLKQKPTYVQLLFRHGYTGEIDPLVKRPIKQYLHNITLDLL